ncbi:hypothetical protein CONCODRAFT_19000 [Conidiobolus coronatus NRRL 28638]|uniref:Uncharacterized protein n=1 Tax=Conidiobolus coronatus (strain ATCC 28846 / CBS 209.66 / NRRL 28638) TaxID=796925 RepID=A0A137P088_CONC2|nr:hypothetical protein CONCODRAFT_19000 [Conidiobolus coronatus NRRL 28638]|eukprot:KXN68402.1 hypothetical protein CONCODRAFT_19000 [Conidiobolus coronatus NRRL 28638]
MKMGSKAFAWRESSSRIIFLITILIQALLVAAVEIYIYTSVISKLTNDPISAQNYEDLKNSAKIALACMGSAMIVCELVLIVFAYKLYQEFGWSIYRLIGSDLTMRRLYLNYQMLVNVPKIRPLKTDDYEFYITLVAIPLSLVILIGVIQGVRREHKVITLVSMMGFLVGLAYFIFKTYRIFDKETAYKYYDYKKFLTLFAVLSIVVLTVSYILTLLCYLNFGKGLERHIHPSNALNLERPPQAHIDLGDE